MPASNVYEVLQSQTKYYNKDDFRLAHKVILVPAEDMFGDWEILIDALTGEIFRVEDKSCYATGSAWVFAPDPITYGQTQYGATGFVDNNDSDSDSLTSQLITVTLNDITYEDGNYYLISPYACIKDFEAPYSGLFEQDSSNFHYTRSEDPFEAINVFYHIDNSMRYVIDTLGFDAMPTQHSGGVQFDVHSLS